MKVSDRYRQIVCSLLGIERWHSGGEKRHPYRQEILRRLSEHEPYALLEIGCGLGDIICRANAQQRVGGDVSQRVLWAARLCHPWQVIVHGVHFRKIRLGELVSGRFNAVCVVNFIHNIPPSDLRAYLQLLVQDNLAPQGLLVFDVVANPEYQYNHDADYLLYGLGMQTQTVSGFEFGRSLVFARKEAAN